MEAPKIKGNITFQTCRAKSSKSYRNRNCSGEEKGKIITKATEEIAYELAGRTGDQKEHYYEASRYLAKDD